MSKETTPTPETDAKHVELGIEYSVMSASYYEMRKHARAMESRALAAEAKAPKWQPMETAPHDGTRILIGNRHSVVIGRWDGFGFVDVEDFMAIHDPLGWMPLPTPPMKEGE